MSVGEEGGAPRRPPSGRPHSSRHATILPQGRPPPPLEADHPPPREQTNTCKNITSARMWSVKIKSKFCSHSFFYHKCHLIHLSGIIYNNTLKYQICMNKYNYLIFLSSLPCHSIFEVIFFLVFELSLNLLIGITFITCY